MVVVNESGLYNLILRSDKLQAKVFKRWITHDVLPAIRKTGSYTTNPPSELDIVEGMVRALRVYEDRVARIEARQNAQDQEGHYWTIYEFAQYTHKHVDPDAAIMLGKRASSYCRLNSIKIGKRKVAGRVVGTYPEDVLKPLFDQWYLQFPLIEE